MAMEVYQLSISGMLAGQYVQNVLHFRIDNIDGDNDWLVARSASIELFPAGAPAGFSEKYIACLPASWLGGAARVRRINPGGGNSAVSTLDPSSYVGQRPDPPVPMTAGPLLILVGTAADNATGRVFLPGLAEDDCENGRVSDPLIIEINALVTEMLTGFTFTPGVTSYDAEWGIWDRANLTFDALLGGYVSPKIGTQRRRYVPIG